MNLRYTHCLTLRLEPKIDDLITEAAYDRRESNSDFIRAAIRQRLKLQEKGGECE